MSRFKSVLFFVVAVFALASVVRAERLPSPLYEPRDLVLDAGGPDLLLKAKVVASGNWSKQVPEFAVDGKRVVSEHWACENLPVWLTVDMGAEKEINEIGVWFYWSDSRVYRYIIEGSLDNKVWETLADRRENMVFSTEKGFFHSFALRKVRYVRTTITYSSRGESSGGHIVEIEAYKTDPAVAQQRAELEASWAKVKAGLQGSIGSIDERYRRNLVPDVKLARSWKGVAWRGERLNAQAVLWSSEAFEQVRLEASPLENAKGEGLGVESLSPFFVRYTEGEGGILPDILDTAERLDMEARSVRPVWVTLEIPRDAKPGVYKGVLTVRAQGGVVVPFEFEVEVLAHVLPVPYDWKFHLDLWQNPFAVARYHQVELWSDEHFVLLEPLYRRLAGAGQKCLTVSILHRPWGGQTYDYFHSMVEWTHRADGSFEFDFSVFDKYVEFGAKVGLDRNINCYSMIPWSNQLRYMDEATGDYVTVPLNVGTEEWRGLWRPFLQAFEAHVKAKGLLGRTFIAMDERPPKMMAAAIELIKETAPGLKIASAENHAPELTDDIDDWSVAIEYSQDPALIQRRAESQNYQTTFYVCCGPSRPNTFTHSPPAESAWLGLHAAAMGYSGFLRWAYCSWVADPFMDTMHAGKSWPAGDCFLVYPGSRSSIRFERLREGIQDYEKIRILKSRAMKASQTDVRDALKVLDDALAKMTYRAATKRPASEFVAETKAAIEALGRAVKP